MEVQVGIISTSFRKLLTLLCGFGLDCSGPTVYGLGLMLLLWLSLWLSLLLLLLPLLSSSSHERLSTG